MAVFALPAVQAVIHYKWTKWARRFLLYELAAYCTWVRDLSSRVCIALLKPSLLLAVSKP